MLLVKIVWDDAVTDVGWEVDVSPNLERVTSVGFIMSENEQQIVLAADISNDKEDNVHTNRRIAIPVPWIVSRDELYEC